MVADFISLVIILNGMAKVKLAILAFLYCGQYKTVLVGADLQGSKLRYQIRAFIRDDQDYQRW